MHRQRWITGLILLPALIVLISAGGMPLALFAALAGAIAAFEYLRIVGVPEGKTNADPLGPLLLVSVPAIVISANWAGSSLVVAALAGNLILAAIVSTFFYAGGRPIPVDQITRQVFGTVYIALPLASLILMRQQPDGAARVFWVLLMAFGGDIGAFYAGLYAGKHKLCPTVSPKKTIEGFVGGMATCFVIGALFKALFLPDLSWGACVALFLAIGVIAPLGDLFESMLKRIGDIKDSGIILPGHGGMLDRIDALLFAAPVAYLFSVLMF